MKISPALVLKSALAMLLLSALSLPAHAMVYVGSWDLSGNGVLDSVYRVQNGVRIVGASGARRDYTIRNNAWSLYGAADTDGRGGSELILRAGPDVIIIDHAGQSMRSYNMGNISWAIMQHADVDNKPGAELLISTTTGVRVVNDANGGIKDIRLNYSGTWTLFGLANLNGGGLDLVINRPGGVIIADPRSGGIRNHTLTGSTAIFGIASLAKGNIQHVIARNASHVFVISGGSNGGPSAYNIGTRENWAIYHQTADTDGKEGDEVIVKLATSVMTIQHASGGMGYHRVGTAFSIDAVQDMDSKPGKEILVRTSSGATYVFNDASSSRPVAR